LSGSAAGWSCSAGHPPPRTLASSTNTSGSHRSPGQDRRQSSETLQALRWPRDDPGSYICRVEVAIRAYDPRDAADLADVFFRSVRQVALSDYTAAQVRAWAPEPRTAEWAHGEASDGRLVLVAANADDRPVAYIDLEPDGHIDRVFCAPEAAGQGIASRLYDAVEVAAREQGIRSLFTEASELARRLFERKGFAVVERQNLVIRGVAINGRALASGLVEFWKAAKWSLCGRVATLPRKVH